MDFELSEDQQAVRDLAAKILDDQVTPERLKEVEAGEERFDRRTWDELAKAGLLGISLPEVHGGGGLGYLETAIVAREVARTVAPVPVLASIALGALPIAEFGTSAQRAAWLPGAASGDVILTGALHGPADVEVRDGVLHGERSFVAAVHLASRVLLPARDGGRIDMYLVDPSGAGVRTERSEATDRTPRFRLSFDGAPAERLGDGTVGGDEVVRWTSERAVAAMALMQAGVSAAALRMTADYVSTREQFDHPLASFQAVSQRAADAFIDATAIELTAWQAVWRLSEGLPAADEVAIAKFWAAEAGQRVGNATQHLHGGIGVDMDYPLHRYFNWSKMLELDLGGATAHLLDLGASIAST